MRDLRATEAVTQLEDAPRCLSCEGLLAEPIAGTCDRPCVDCGALHHAAGKFGLWQVRPIGTNTRTTERSMSA